MYMDPQSMKYVIKAKIVAEGVVERPDVVGAIFGQTEGLLGEELDLRDLQKSGRIGRIEVEIKSQKGKSEGHILVPSSLDQIETAIIAAALETIDRVGPCKAHVEVISIEDIRASKRRKIIERAQELAKQLLEQNKSITEDLVNAVRGIIESAEIITYGEDRLPAGPNVPTSDAVIIVEGRSDVLNLLRYGIKNAIAVNGTSIPETIIKLSREKVVTAFLDGDRGGDLILKELLQVADIDFVTRAPQGYEVEELTYKQIIKALRNKMPVDQYLALHGMTEELKSLEERRKAEEGHITPPEEEKKPEKQSRARKRKEEKKTREEEKLLQDASSRKVALLVDGEMKVVAEYPIGELVEKLSVEDVEAEAVVLGGVVSQRLVDVAQRKGIKKIYAYRLGNVTKKPADLKIITLGSNGRK